MKGVRSSAPGKLVLCGEYVVLDGAPAIGVAVDRRSVVTLTPVDGATSILRCPGLDDIERHFTRDAQGDVAWLRGDAPALFAAALAAIPGLPPVEAVLDTTVFFGGCPPAKLGLGSSASLCVALLGALSGHIETTPALERAQAVHREFQGGRGSGIDIATSFSGGVVRFEIERAAEPQPLHWPGDLQMAVFWTGEPSDTIAGIGRFEDSDSEASARRHLADASVDVVDAWVQGGDPLPALSGYTRRLHEFDADLALGIFSDAHETLFRLAAGHGVLYKPCGAGGGDVGIALARSADAVDTFSQAASALGIERLDVHIDNDGLVVEEYGS